MEEKPDHSAVCQESRVPQDQALTENEAHDRHVHRISDIAIETSYNQMTGWKDGRGGAQALYREPDERVQKPNGPDGEQNSAGKAERRQSQEGGFHLPMGDPPGD